MIRTLFFAVTAALLLASLWFFFSPQAAEQRLQHGRQMLAQDNVDPVDSHEPSTGITTADYSWQIRGDQIIGPQQIEVPEGEILLLAFLSDSADDIHLHGYEQALTLTANEPATLSLTLEHSGRFELESHRLHRPLSVIAVEPR